jgi:deoxyxylulose-5-phosphate synthase
VALHYTFNTPHDRIVWDVGHQTYAHKILTGRRQAMAKLRQADGPSGFRAAWKANTTRSAPRIVDVDFRGAGDGGRGQTQREDRRAIAVIGDGAMSAGMAFEALNNAGISGTDLLVILNDNDMSISEPVGALTSIWQGPVVTAVQLGATQRRRRCWPSCRRRCTKSPGARKSTSRGWCCPARCSRSSASTTSARSTATTWTRW